MKGVKASRRKRVVLGVVLVLMSSLLFAFGGSGSHRTNAWSGRHMAADVNTIMATGGSCAPGTG